MNQTFQSEWWQATLPPGWSGSHNDDYFTADSKDGGVLQITAHRKDEAVTDDDLFGWVAEDAIEVGTRLTPARFPSFTGFHFCYEEEDTWWRMWVLRSGHTLLYVTYNCDFKDQDDETEPVAQLLSSLKVRG